MGIDGPEAAHPAVQLLDLRPGLLLGDRVETFEGDQIVDRKTPLLHRSLAESGGAGPGLCTADLGFVLGAADLVEVLGQLSLARTHRAQLAFRIARRLTRRLGGLLCLTRP